MQEEILLLKKLNYSDPSSFKSLAETPGGMLIRDRDPLEELARRNYNGKTSEMFLKWAEDYNGFVYKMIYFAKWANTITILLLSGAPIILLFLLWFRLFVLFRRINRFYSKFIKIEVKNIFKILA